MNILEIPSKDLPVLLVALQQEYKSTSLDELYYHLKKAVSKLIVEVLGTENQLREDLFKLATHYKRVAYKEGVEITSKGDELPERLIEVAFCQFDTCGSFASLRIMLNLRAYPDKENIIYIVFVYCSDFETIGEYGEL